MLVVGGPLVFALQQRAANERVAAINVDLTEALLESEKQRTRADAARAAADRNLKSALEAVDTMLTRVGQDTLRDVPQMVSVRRTLLQDALDFYTALLRERETDPTLVNEVRFARDRVASLHMLLGDMASAERELEALVGPMSAEAVRADADAGTLHAYADVQSRLGEVHLRRGALEKSRACLVDAIATFERIPADRRDVKVEIEHGKCQDRLADLAQQEGRGAEAESAARAAVAISREGRARFPDDPRFLASLGRQLDRLGTLLVHAGRAKDGVGALSESAAVLEEYRRRAPADAHGREKLAITLINFANGLTALGDAPGAKRRTEEALELDEALVRDFPDVPSYRTDLAIVHLQLFVHAYRAKDLKSAEHHIGRTIELQESVARDKPDDASLLGEMAGTCVNLAALQTMRDDPAASLSTCDRGIAHVSRALSKTPDHPKWRDILRTLQNNRGFALLDQGRWQEAALTATEIDASSDHEWFSRRAQILERSSRVASQDKDLDDAERVARAGKLRDRALEDLTRAVELGRTDWSELSAPDEWTSLRADPRFTALVQRSRAPR